MNIVTKINISTIKADYIVIDMYKCNDEQKIEMLKKVRKELGLKFAFSDNLKKVIERYNIELLYIYPNKLTYGAKHIYEDSKHHPQYVDFKYYTYDQIIISKLKLN